MNNHHRFPRHNVMNFVHSQSKFMFNPMPQLMIPKNNSMTVINRKNYIFYRKLGNGAFGHVFAARNIAGNHLCAVKVIRLDPKNRVASRHLIQSIIKEIQMSKRLARLSPNVVYMFDFDFDPKSGRAFIVMELGQNDLEKTLSSRPPLAPIEVKNIWRQLANIALNLHNFSIVHLDIKPQNLVVFPGNIIKLADLGIAEKANTFRNGPNGTPYYSAPEVVNPPPFHTLVNTTKSDSWSWGAVLYRMIYLRPPTYTMPCSEPPYGIPPYPDPDFQDLLKKTLSYDINGRVDPPALSYHPYTTT